MAGSIGPFSPSLQKNQKKEAQQRARKQAPQVELSLSYLRKAQAEGLPLPEDVNGELPLPAEPTQALPGTTEKLAVFAERYAVRTQLYHPEDAKRPATGRPGQAPDAREMPVTDAAPSWWRGRRLAGSRI